MGTMRPPPWTMATGDSDVMSATPLSVPLRRLQLQAGSWVRAR